MLGVVSWKALQEVGLVFVQALGQRAGDLELQRVAAGDLGGALLDHAEQDHGHDLVERLFHQDGGFDGGQAALDAVAFDGDLGRQVLQLAALSLDGREDRHADEHEAKEANAQQGLMQPESRLKAGAGAGGSLIAPAGT